MKHLIPLLICFILSCQNAPTSLKIVDQKENTQTTDPSYVWTKLLDSAEWKKSYNFQMFSVKDTFWVFHHDGNWFSTNGVQWTKSMLTNPIFNLAFLDYVSVNDTIFGLGRFEGNIEEYNFHPNIYRTLDFKQWETLSTKSNLPQRFFYHPFVFDNKIWIVGGEDKVRQFADIWNSSDGIHWVKVKDNLPFGRRSNSQVVFLNKKLYLLNNDVWSSSDGLQWEKVSDEIVENEEIFGYSAQVFDGKIWLIGCNRNGQFSSQVLFSDDGKSWQSLNAPWLPRGGVAAAVHHNKIYLTGGKYGGTPNHPEFRYDNDLWVLEKKE